MVLWCRDSENQTPEAGENQDFEREEGLPRFLCTRTNKPSLAKNLTAQADGRKTDANSPIGTLGSVKRSNCSTNHKDLFGSVYPTW